MFYRTEESLDKCGEEALPNCEELDQELGHCMRKAENV